MQTSNEVGMGLDQNLFEIVRNLYSGMKYKDKIIWDLVTNLR